MIRAKQILLSTAALSLLTACTDPAYVAGNAPAGSAQQYDKTQQGAMVGAVAGGVLGALIGNDGAESAVKGAVIGGLAGAGVGYSLDRQEAQLRQDLNNSNIGVQNTGDRLIVTLPQDITFASDSYTVNPGLRADLNTVAQSLMQYPNSTVQIVGHTDNTGEAAYNQTLSERRANAVADILMTGGVPFNRLQTFGRGEDQPVASNLTEEGKAQNRRVEIVILPTPA